MHSVSAHTVLVTVNVCLMSVIAGVGDGSVFVSALLMLMIHRDNNSVTHVRERVITIICGMHTL